MALFDVNNNIRKVTATANGSLTVQVNNTTDLDVFLDGVFISFILLLLPLVQQD